MPGLLYYRGEGDEREKRDGGRGVSLLESLRAG